MKRNRMVSSVNFLGRAWDDALAMESESSTRLASGQVLWSAIFVLLIAAVGILLTMQGWRSRVPAFDLLTYIYSGRDLLDNGTIPQHGDTGSYGSYKPPGTAWLMLPSMLISDDPRLSEYAGTALLHLSTLAGIFLLARHYFGMRCAYLSVLLYGLSHHGLFLAGSLWPNGRPDFYVWIVYLTTRWVSDRNARFLAGAAAVWAIGMYVDMAITPAILILPAAWLYYRPPVRFRPLLLGSGVALLIWTPYLGFQVERDLKDLRSQLLLQPISHGDYRSTWCDPNLTMLTWSDEVLAGSASAEPVTNSPVTVMAYGGVGRLVETGTTRLVSNFRAVASIPGADFVLLLLTIVSIATLSVSPTTGRTFTFIVPSYLRSVPRRAPPRALIGAFILSALVLIFAFVALIFGLDKISASSGIIDRAPRLVAQFAILGFAATVSVIAINRILSGLGVKLQTRERAERVWLLALSLVIPWSVLLVVAESGKPERFWWLWPLQIIFLSAFFTVILPRLGTPRVLAWTAQLAVIVIVVANGFLWSRVESWKDDGWSGPEAEEVQVVDYVAQDLDAEGRDESRIGYQILIFPFMASYNITNERYKAGAEFDIMFAHRHDIENMNTCAEGIALNDDYRIFQTRPKPWDGSPRNYFQVALDPSYQLIGEVASYQVFKRDGDQLSLDQIVGRAR